MVAPFATSATWQTARKTSAREGCSKIARSHCYAPRHRSPGYDLRRTPCDHRNLASNAAHGGLIQCFPNFQYQRLAVSEKKPHEEIRGAKACISGKETHTQS